MSEKSSPKKNLDLKCLLVIVTVVWCVYWAIIMAYSFTKDDKSTGWTERGQFGDMFGALNALFSGLAFAGIIYSIRQQSEDLKLQQRTLKLTLKELEKSAEAQKKSEEALNNQTTIMLYTARLNAYSSMMIYNQSVMDNNIDYHPSEKYDAKTNLTIYSKKLEDLTKKIEQTKDFKTNKEQ